MGKNKQGNGPRRAHAKRRRHEGECIVAALGRDQMAEGLALLGGKDAELLRLFYGWEREPVEEISLALNGSGYPTYHAMQGRQLVHRALTRMLAALGEQNIGPLCEYCAEHVPLYSRAVEGKVLIAPCKRRTESHHYWRP